MTDLELEAALLPIGTQPTVADRASSLVENTRQGGFRVVALAKKKEPSPGAAQP